jgi:hypothetical protein
MKYGFKADIDSIIRTGRSRSIVLTGNVYDLFGLGDKKYEPLLEFLSEKYTIDHTDLTHGMLVVTYAMNDDVTIVGNGESIKEFQELWKKFKGEDDLFKCLKKTNGHPTYALEIMRQMSICSRTYDWSCHLTFVIEGADMILPEEEISRMNVADRRRVAIIHDWFSDPKFMDGFDIAILISESKSQLHGRISKLPQVIEVKAPYPSWAQRRAFLKDCNCEESLDEIATKTAGLSLHAMKQLVKYKDYSNDYIFKQVEDHIIGQIGEGVVEFKVPSHTFKDVVGFKKIKEFCEKELIPAFQTTDKDLAISGAAIGGPIGGGKTFLCEALAAELKMPVLVLKNLRSMYYGQTDVIFERLLRALTALDKVCIFVDEADTVFGGVTSGHDTERRLTGKVQAMMSDPRLKGKVLWLLMTARIHLLSPDIRRPGRVGDLIIPILDPEDSDRKEFIEWVFGDIEGWESLCGTKFLTGKSAAWYASMRSQLKRSNCNSIEHAKEIIEEVLVSDIESEREYQKLQALVNCTRKSLLPIGGKREAWLEEIKRLKMKRD